MGTRRHRSICAILIGSLVAVVPLASGTRARAATITYTFTGVGNGTLDSNPWTGSFTFTFTGDTANITSGGGEFFQRNIGGTVTEGSFTGTLPATSTLVDNTDPANPRFGFFNSTIDNGGTIQNPAFTTYNLATSIGPITGTGANLLPTLNPNGNGFTTTNGDTIELLGITSLTATAALQTVPEPSTLCLGATSVIVGLGVFVVRRRARAIAR